MFFTKIAGAPPWSDCAEPFFYSDSLLEARGEGQINDFFLCCPPRRAFRRLWLHQNWRSPVPVVGLNKAFWARASRARSLRRHVPDSDSPTPRAEEARPPACFSRRRQAPEPFGSRCAQAPSGAAARFGPRECGFLAPCARRGDSVLRVLAPRWGNPMALPTPRALLACRLANRRTFGTIAARDPDWPSPSAPFPTNRWGHFAPRQRPARPRSRKNPQRPSAPPASARCFSIVFFCPPHAPFSGAKSPSEKGNISLFLSVGKSSMGGFNSFSFLKKGIFSGERS